MQTTNFPQTEARRAVRVFAIVVGLGSLASGCMGPIFRPQSPDAGLDKAGVSVDPPSQTQLVSAIAHPYGMNYVKLKTSRSSRALPARAKTQPHRRSGPHCSPK